MAKNPKEPVRGPKAFDEESPEASMSRSAVLLEISARLDRPGPRIFERRNQDAERDDAFEVPFVPKTGERFRLRPPWRDDGLDLLRRTSPERKRAELADELFRDPQPQTAAMLADAYLRDHDELTRVAAAVLDFRLSADTRHAVATLAEGTASKDELVRDVAATGLARVVPRHPALDPLRRANPEAAGGYASQTSMIVHGTWARTFEWWQPGGTFHSFLKDGYRTDLYARPDRFEWTGGYSDGARAEAGEELARWIFDHREAGISLITHSHGGNVAFLASGASLPIDDLIVLSCPVRDEYVPNFLNIHRVVSVRVKWDLVILVDGGGQYFDDPRIKEVVLPIWFNHSATHDPEVWDDRAVAARIEAP